MTEATTETPTCPICGSPGIPIVYGMPGPDLAEAAGEGRVVLGGCVAGPMMPNWECTGRGRHTWWSGDGEDE